MRRWRICWFTVGLPSTAFTLHVAVTWNARSVRMRPNGSPNNDRQHWFQRARNVPGGNEVLVLLTKWIGSRLRFGCRRLSSFSTAPHGRVSALCAKEAVAKRPSARGCRGEVRYGAGGLEAIDCQSGVGEPAA